MVRWHGALVVWAALTFSAFAQDSPMPNLAATGAAQPGGVAALTFAQQLYSFGQSRRDAQSMLAAARMAKSVTLRRVEMVKETLPVSEADGVVPAAPAAVPPDPAAMLALARDYAGNDETLLLLIEAAERETADGGLTAAWAASKLNAGQSDVWTLPFFGAALAEIGVIGAAGSPLVLRVADENDLTICQDSGAGAEYCSWYPARNGEFTLHVTNPGTAPQDYMLIVN